MHVHILGICGTFMGGVAALARAAGHEVSGSDKAVYPPMSTQLEQLGVTISDLDDPDQFRPRPDIVVVGNVMSRGHPTVERLLNDGLPYTSGPAWLADHVLRERWVLAVAGTHGKTTTASMLAWLLEHANLAPGFLIGGVARNFDASARLGSAPFFVVEADEYDCAFFDKRSKFVHYRPRTLVLNNLEFDHADIFPDLRAIKTQFHHLVRTVPGNGRIVVNGGDANLADVLSQGAWTPTLSFGAARDSVWRADLADGTLTLQYRRETVGEVPWRWPGEHNAQNAAAACAAAHDAGVPVAVLMEGLATFGGVKRRAEAIGEVHGVRVFDDFAHHPTAIRLTLEGFRRAEPAGRLLAVIEPRSNTMRMGSHKDELAASIAAADLTWFYRPPDLAFDLEAVVSAARIHRSHAGLLADVIATARPGDRIVIMSNGGFGNLHTRLLGGLGARFGRQASGD